MPEEKAELVVFQVGTFVCPNTKTAVPLMASHALPFLQWPVLVERCPGCEQRHVVSCEDVQHPPAFGYE